MIKYEVQHYQGGKQNSTEFCSKSEARAYAAIVLAGGTRQVTVITWNVSPNLPRAKPDYVYRSCGMEVLRDIPGCYPVWYLAAIHGGPYQEWEA